MKTSDDKLSPKVRKLKREISKKVAERARRQLGVKQLNFIQIFMNVACTPRSA